MPTSSNGGDLIAIRCHGLGKRYRIGEQVRYKTLRETLTTSVQAPFRWLRSRHTEGLNQKKTEFWALRDLTLEVKHGEVLGVIGRNGAGKSTLLKVLSRITKPTLGTAEICGRVGTLLEVGAGFHPELTGRENIFLNGAMLGMKRGEITSKFDQIVEFAECGGFLDTPIKHFSSGMYVRLAFAVAAHLETEILFVDEVLSVGDAVFQKKCLGKIGDVASQGRTVLFVSHNLLAVESLCTRAICLHEGRIVLEGTPSSVTTRYLQNWLPKFKQVMYEDRETAPGDENFRLHRAQVRAQEETAGDRLTVRTPLVFELEYWKHSNQSRIDLGVAVFNEHGVNVFTTGRFESCADPAGLLRSSFCIPGDLLNCGTYRIHLSVLLGGLTLIANWEDLLTFEVHDVPSELRGFYHGEWPGAIRPNLAWKTELIEAFSESAKNNRGNGF